MNFKAMPVYKQDVFVSSARAMPNRILFWATAETTIDFIRPDLLPYEGDEGSHRPLSITAVSQD
jgi:hypothetical protein